MDACKIVLCATALCHGVMCQKVAIRSDGHGVHMCQPRASLRRTRHGLICEPSQAWPEAVAETAAVSLVAAMGISWFQEKRNEKSRREEWAAFEAREEAAREERRTKAYIAPKELWSETELAAYDGENQTGPLLIAVDGKVYNAWKGRHFYGPGCEYHIMAGRDATRLLGKQKLEEETEEELQKPLTIAERATLMGWAMVFDNKYDLVGRLAGHDPNSTAINRLEGTGSSVEAMANARPW